MPRITFIQPDGSECIVAAQEGQTVKDAAISSLVPGIVAECGGSCACATCHVRVDEHSWDLVASPSDSEAEMLEFADEVTPKSRLACQIRVTEEVEGLVVHVPKTQ